MFHPALFLPAFLVLLISLFFPGTQAAAQAREPWSAGLRLHTSAGRDSNVEESLEESFRREETFVRFLGQAGLTRRDLPAGLEAELGFRLLAERYSNMPREARYQEEVGLILSLPGPARGGRTRIEGGWGGRRYPEYPDSSTRNYQRWWVRPQTLFRLGPEGTLRVRADLWGLDFRRTAPRDQVGLGLDLTYEHPLRRWFLLDAGLELGGVRHGLPSIQVERQDPMEDPRPVYGPDRRDDYRFLHAGLRWTRWVLLRIQYGYRSQASNSIDADLSRHEVRWLLARRLPLDLQMQFYGNLETTDYSDPDLDVFDIVHVGEVEAHDDDNTVAVRISRSLGSGFTADLRHSWFRNESLFVHDYYHKRVWSFGLNWETGHVSGF